MVMQHKAAAAFLLLFASAATAAAQCAYTLDAPRYLQEPQSSASLVGVADLDHDGRPDVVTGDAIFFGLTRLVPVANEGFALRVVADVNGDGWADLIGTKDDGSIRAYINQRDGSFAAVDSAAPAAVQVASRDFNHDGFDDLAILTKPASGDDVTIEIYLGDGRGHFFAAQTLGPFSSHAVLLLGDFNGDRNPDIAVENVLLAGDGTGHFAAPVPFGPLGPLVGVADVDGDGSDEVVLEGTGLWVLHGNHPATMTQIAGFPMTTSYSGGSLGDVNGDGAPDIVIPDPASGELSVALNDGHGNFAPLRPVSSAPFFARSPILADVNGDGLADLLIDAPDGIVVYSNNGNATFRTEPPRIAGASGNLMARGDFDGDGNDDVIILHQATPSDVIWNAAASTAVQHVSTPRWEFIFGAADIDHDGIDEVLVGEGNTVAAVDITHDGTLLYRTRVNTAATPMGVVAGHFLDRARTDLAVVSMTYGGGGKLEVFDLSTSTVAYSSPLPDSNLGFGLAAADLNGDGMDDLIAVANGSQSSPVSAATGGSVITFLATGGSLIAAHAYDSPYPLWLPAAGDFNGDGAIDVALVSYDQPRGIAWMKGDGHGHLAAPQSVARKTRKPQPQSPNDVPMLLRVADLDGDGYDDIVAVTDSAVLLNFGSAQGPARLLAYAVPGSNDKSVPVRARGEKFASLFVSGEQSATLLRPTCGRKRAAGHR